MLIRALRDANLPKFLSADCELFREPDHGPLPGARLSRRVHRVTWSGPLSSQSGEVDLQPKETFVTQGCPAVRDIQRALRRHACRSHGRSQDDQLPDSQVGDDKASQRTATTTPFQVIHTYVFNPKCIKMGELYGEYNDMTGEWTDGLGSTLIRNAVADCRPMDEKVGGVRRPRGRDLDREHEHCARRQLHAVPSQRQRSSSTPITMRMLFEVQDLAVASPATVSRCGMVYMPPNELGWLPYVTTWSRTRSCPRQ